VRPVASDDAAYFVIHGSYDLGAFLNLPADHLKLFWTERAALQEFDWHVGPTRDLGRLFLGHTAPLRNRAHGRVPASARHPIDHRTAGKLNRCWSCWFSPATRESGAARSALTVGAPRHTRSGLLSRSLAYPQK
jgi:hypothetical protein